MNIRKTTQNGLIPIMTVGMAPMAAKAVPTLQVGAPAGIGDSGTYADYQVSTTNPTETDTAITGGNTILFAGVFGPNTLKLGGQYIGAVDGDGSRPDGLDYSGIDGNLGIFDDHDAIAVVSVAEGSLATALANLTIGGNSAFHSSLTLDGLFPNNHDPLKDLISDFLFFDIGNFANNQATVPDFCEPGETGCTSDGTKKDGEIKSLAIAGTTGLDWIHFDVVALATDSQGQTRVRTSWEFNPPSHDVTWKTNGGTGEELPEPSTLLLSALGLIGIGIYGRRRRQS